MWAMQLMGYILSPLGLLVYIFQEIYHLTNQILRLKKQK